MEKINFYETLFVVDVAKSEEQTTETVNKFVSLIGENAEILETNEWGTKRLAYPINDQPDGYYTVVSFKSAPEFPAELERLMNIDENVLRSLTIRLDFDPIERKERLAKEAAEKAAKAAEAAAAAEAAEKAAAEAAAAPADAE